MADLDQEITAFTNRLKKHIHKCFAQWLRPGSCRMAADGVEGNIMESVRLQKSEAYIGEDGESGSGDEEDIEEENGGFVEIGGSVGEDMEQTTFRVEFEESCSGDEEDFEEKNVGFDEFDGSVGEDIEQTTFRVEFEEDFVCCEENGDMEQSTYTVECKEEIAGLLKHDVVRLSGEFVPTGNLHGVVAKAKTTRLGSLISCARGLVLRNKMVVKNLVVLGTFVAKPLLQAAETIANGIIMNKIQ